MKSRIIAGIVLLLLLLYGLSGLYTVSLSENGVVRRFGRIDRIAGPGWHYRLPWPVESVVNVVKTTTLLMSVGYRVSREDEGLEPLPEETEWLLGDLNIMTIKMGVNYYIDDPARFVTFIDKGENLMSPDFIIRSIGESTLTNSLGRIRYEDLLARRVLFEQETMQAIQERLDEYGSGLKIQNVTLDVNPPAGTVARAFQEAKTAQAESERAKSDAESDANTQLQAATADAYRLVAEASAEYNNTVQQARAEADAFLQLAKEYEQAPRETAERLYWQTVTRIRERSKKIIVDGREDASPVRVFMEPGK